MKPISSKNDYVLMFVGIFFVLLSLYFAMPRKFPKLTTSTQTFTQYCRPELDNSSAPTIEAPSFNDGNKGPITTYRRVKSNVLIPQTSLYDPNDVGERIHSIPDEQRRLADGKLYRLMYPSPVAGKSYPYKHSGGESPYFEFWRYGVLLVQHLEENGGPTQGKVPGLNEDIHVIDIYKDINKPDLPKEVLECTDFGDMGGSDLAAVFPKQSPSSDSMQQQLEWFVFGKNSYLPKAWWVPFCKPAIYLYPKEKTLVNVKVQTKGFLTYTDPVYDSKLGWNVTAFPDGNLTTSYPLPTTNYPYLYYESKVPDHLVKKPTQGFVVKQDELTNLFHEILPNLGLNDIQTKDFIDYWKKALKSSPYYFVGIIDQKDTDQMEPLEITPKPDVVNRVRIYFEALDAPINVENPNLSNYPLPTTNYQLKVVEWGGMVKNDPTHPFTCSQ